MEAMQRSNGRVLTILSLEALIAGFYVVITRGLAPIMMYSVGLRLSDIIGINALAYLAALVLTYILHEHSEYLRRNANRKLLISHILERVFWGLLPLALINSPTLFYALYVLAIMSTVPTTVLVNNAIYTFFRNVGVRDVVKRRNALGAASSILGQVFVITTLYSIQGVVKYVYLYLIAMFAGFISSSIIAMMPRIDRLTPITHSVRGEEEIKASNTFLFLTLLLSAASIINTVWPPFIMSLGGKDYLAASLGFIQMLTNIAASIVWSRVRYTRYKVAILTASLVPLTIILVKNPLLHLLIASIYSFAITGSNLLASLLYGDIVRGYDALKASIKLVGAGSLAQVIGLSTAYTLSLASPTTLFIASSILSVLASIVALTTIPEVAIPKEANVRMFSRTLYNLSIAGYSFLVLTLRSSAILTLRIAGLAFILLILYIIYRLLFYIALITYH